MLHERFAFRVLRDAIQRQPYPQRTTYIRIVQLLATLYYSVLTILLTDPTPARSQSAVCVRVPATEVGSPAHRSR
eukprot:6182873-Pleurochrysis_carterae.AAC.3